MFKVQKKDGSLQDYDRAKVVGGAVKAGASPEEAETVANQIEAWLPTVAAAGVVNSMDIRSKGLEILKTVNPTAAATFESYQKTVTV